MAQPFYPRDIVRRLAADPATFEMYQTASDDALGFGLDDEEVREIFQRIDEWDCVDSKPTEKYYPGTISDYYIYYVDECLTRMFIKFLIFEDRLIVSSFKEDESR